MESILSIVSLVAVYSIVYVIKSLGSKSADVEAKPLTGEAFPTIEVFEPSVESDTPVMLDAPACPAPAVVREKQNTAPAKKRTIVHSAPHTTCDSGAPVTASAPAGNRLGLKTKSEAKRAFLYSEIFKRKY